MQQELIEQFQFQDKEKQSIFETLISRKRYPLRPFVEQDLKVDLVLRMQMPKQAYDLKSKQPPFSQLFQHAPKDYGQMYELVSQYINYLVEANQQQGDLQNPLIRNRTAIHYVSQGMVKKKKIQLDLVQENVSNVIEMQCNYAFEDKIDIFTLRYNMLMLVLQQLCGFRVRTFILEDQTKNIGQKGRRSVYFLLSQSHQNLLKLADRYKIKKQIDMGTLDFSVNDPIDSKNRPIKTNNFFKKQQCKNFSESIKKLNRDLHLSNKQFLDEIIQDVQLSQRDITKIEQYYAQLEQIVHQVFLPTQFKAKMLTRATVQINSFRQPSSRRPNTLQYPYLNIPSSMSIRHDDRISPSIKTDVLDINNLRRLNNFQRQYIYNINRQKINPGCEDYMLQLKKKKYIFDKIIQLNKKYGYSVYQYQDCFVQFMLPNKKKSFFDKLQHMLQYQWYNITPSGQISLFTSMQRIKLAYLCIQEKVKVQNLSKIGAQIYAINSDYEKTGNTSAEFNKYLSEQSTSPSSFVQSKQKKEKSKVTFLVNAWHPWISFKTNIRVVRDYMGDNFGLTLAFKAYLITYLLIVAPVSIGLQVAFKLYFYEDHQYDYFLSFGQCIFLFISFTFLIKMWEKYQTEYFNNYLETCEHSDSRAAYKGPYVRNFITDTPNSFVLHTQTSRTADHLLRQSLAYLIIGLLLVIQGLYFWGIRKLVVAQYPNFPVTYYFPISHFLFYGIYFVTNKFLYFFVIKHLLNKLTYFLNFAKLSQHHQSKRRHNEQYVFGVEIVPLFFFFILQNFNGATCYSFSCSLEFEFYIVCRFVIQAAVHLLFRVPIIIYMIRNSFVRSKIMGQDSPENKQVQLTFQYKLGQILLRVQYEQNKQQIDLILQQEKVVFLFYGLFFVRFPLCGFFSLMVLLINYIANRIQILKTKRRPIPHAATMQRYSQYIRRMYFLTIIVNSWSIVFTYDFLQYHLKYFYEVFVPTLTYNNMMTFRLVFTCILFVFFYTLTIIFQRIAQQFGASQIFEQRKLNKFQQFILKAKGKPTNLINLKTLVPLKTIFRTFTIETVIQYKKNKFKFLKMKLKAPPQVQVSEKSIKLDKYKNIHSDQLPLLKTNNLSHNKTLQRYTKGVDKLGFNSFRQS